MYFQLKISSSSWHVHIHKKYPSNMYNAVSDIRHGNEKVRCPKIAATLSTINA